MLKPSNMHDYQLDGTGFLVDTSRSALMAGLGLGKTIMTLTALAELQSMRDMERALIIAPKRVAATVWHTEAANWTHTRHLRVARAVGKPNERRSAILSSLAFDHGIVTINPENLEWLMQMLVDMKMKWPFDTVIFDEFSMFKSSSSNRFKTMEKICCDYTKTVKGILHRIESPIERVNGLTATPAASGIGNLWSQVKLLDSGQRLGTKVTHFRKAFMSNQAPPGVKYPKWEPTKDAAENVYEAISDIVKVMLCEDYLDMPDLVQNDIVVDIPPKVRKDMETLEAEFLLEVNENGIDEEIIAANAGALANKLMQFSNGACIAEGTDVLTDMGWLPIEKVTDTHKVWDGDNWVNCDGAHFMGVKDVTELDGVSLTLDHRVLTKSGWKTAEEILNGKTTDARYDRISGVDFLVSDEATMLLENSQRLSKLWGSRYNNMPGMGKVSNILPGHGCSSEGHVSGSNRQYGELLQKQLSVGYSEATVSESEKHRLHKDPLGCEMSIASSPRLWDKQSDTSGEDSPIRKVPRKTYDVFNAGPQQRYLVRGADGKTFLAHNCYVGDPQDPDYEKKWAPVHDAKLDALAELDETCDYPLLVAYWFQSDLERITKKFPKWKVLDKKGSQIEAWNRGEIDRLLIHPASAGHGLNLQYGGNTFVLYSMFWSLELYQQLIGRLHRQGQDQAVSVNRIVIRDSIEQRVAMALASRAETQDDMLNYLNDKQKEN